jgi:hypothetical protein
MSKTCPFLDLDIVFQSLKANSVYRKNELNMCISRVSEWD